MGVEIAIDDVGPGYSSPAYLQTVTDLAASPGYFFARPHAVADVTPWLLD
jgi:hypothetical protein